MAFDVFRGPGSIDPVATEATERRFVIYQSAVVSAFDGLVPVAPHWVARWTDDEGPALFGVGPTPEAALTHLQTRMYAAKRTYEGVARGDGLG